ncbi:probable protein S-acyltransferase 6 [Rhodamnia argentea]|uniref:S-acyltransferase n=1 Tax=Rhodamnia argentea TaxID=178133 RepID=A0A8B8Q7R1_9MYRT|nr:probable protein S-acyltransferase 6 [Rhodamnia argentea]
MMVDAVYPPPSADSAHARDGASFVRAYKAWKGSNIFGLRGRLIFGPDAGSLLLTLLLIIVPVAVFCIFVARKFINDYQHHLGISIMVVVLVLTLSVVIFLLLTSGRDPGIVPRSTHPPETANFIENSENKEGQLSERRPSRTKEVMINGIPVKIKYCDTCMLFRPPRCSHCSICDNCVERFDHHCPWVGQCVGLRNYRFFFMFVFSATLLCIYVFGFCWVYIARIMDGKQVSVWRALIKSPASIVLIIYSFLSAWFVGGLTVFHFYLISTNQTTYENFRYRYGRQTNPFNKGVLDNFKEVFFSPIPPSRNNFRAKVPKEPQFPSQRMNGGFVGQNMSKVISDTELGNNPSWNGSTKEFVNVDRETYIDDRTEHGGGSISESKRISMVNLPNEPQISSQMVDGIVSSGTSEAIANIETEMNLTGDSAGGDIVNGRTTDGGFENDHGLIDLHRKSEE